MTFRSQAPNLLTGLGHVLTIGWLLGGPWWLAALGLAADVLDGQVARELGACSTFGSLYDWSVDVTCAALVAARLGVLPLLVVLVPLQVAARLKNKHASGRAALVALALIFGGAR